MTSLTAPFLWSPQNFDQLGEAASDPPSESQCIRQVGNLVSCGNHKTCPKYLQLSRSHNLPTPLKTFSLLSLQLVPSVLSPSHLCFLFYHIFHCNAALLQIINTQMWELSCDLSQLQNPKEFSNIILLFV